MNKGTGIYMVIVAIVAFVGLAFFRDELWAKFVAGFAVGLLFSTSILTIVANRKQIMTSQNTPEDEIDKIFKSYIETDLEELIDADAAKQAIEQYVQRKVTEAQIREVEGIIALTSSLDRGIKVYNECRKTGQAVDICLTEDGN